MLIIVLMINIACISDRLIFKHICRAEIAFDQSVMSL